MIPASALTSRLPRLCCPLGLEPESTVSPPGEAVTDQGELPEDSCSSTWTLPSPSPHPPNPPLPSCVVGSKFPPVSEPFLLTCKVGTSTKRKEERTAPAVLEGRAPQETGTADIVTTIRRPGPDGDWLQEGQTQGPAQPRKAEHGRGPPCAQGSELGRCLC